MLISYRDAKAKANKRIEEEKNHCKKFIDERMDKVLAYMSEKLIQMLERSECGGINFGIDSQFMEFCTKESLPNHENETVEYFVEQIVEKVNASDGWKAEPSVSYSKIGRQQVPRHRVTVTIDS